MTSGTRESMEYVRRFLRSLPLYCYPISTVHPDLSFILPSHGPFSFVYALPLPLVFPLACSPRIATTVKLRRGRQEVRQRSEYDIRLWFLARLRNTSSTRRLHAGLAWAQPWPSSFIRSSTLSNAA